MHDIALDRITLGNGSNDIIDLLGRVFLGPKRAALYSAHAFAVYSILTHAQDSRAVVVSARAATDAPPYGPDLPDFARAPPANAVVSPVFISTTNHHHSTDHTRDV